jgi:hypothetical protein
VQTHSAPSRQAQLQRGYIMLALVVAGVIIWYVPDTSFATLMATIMISLASLLPAYVWIKGGTRDIPVFPIFALSFLWAYALPMLGDQLYLAMVSETSKLQVGGIISFGLLIGTTVWYWFRRGDSRSRVSLQLPVDRMKGILLFAMAGYAIFSLANAGEMFDVVGTGYLTLVRVILLTLYTLAVFVYFFEIGSGRMQGPRVWIFIALLLAAELVSAASLIIVGSMITTVIGLTAFALGSGRAPWKTAVALLLLFTTLHAGKGEMREKYWAYQEYFRPEPAEYIPLYVEWVGKGLETLRTFGEPRAKDYQSLRERAGLVYLFFLVFEMSPDRIAYLDGESYAPIPRLLVPRFINPDREGTHEGTIILNVHYGLQTRESAQTTTIGWDLISEAQANYGIPGVYVAFVLLALIYARLERWSRGRDIFSFRGMAALLVLTLAAQTGITLAVYITALFQALVALVLLAVFAMERQQLRRVWDSISTKAFRVSRQQ